MKFLNSKLMAGLFVILYLVIFFLTIIPGMMNMSIAMVLMAIGMLAGAVINFLNK